MRKPFIREQGLVIVFFLAMNLIFTHDGSVNALARYASLCSLAESGSFVINGYEGLTIDWARTPDGKYFSNKAPGPMFVAYPLYKVMDAIQTRAGKTDEDKRDIRRRNADRKSTRLNSSHRL